MMWIVSDAVEEVATLPGNLGSLTGENCYSQVREYREATDVRAAHILHIKSQAGPEQMHGAL